MNDNILKLKVDNKDKNLEKYLKPQWSYKTLISIILSLLILIFIVKDLEIDFAISFGEKALKPNTSDISHLLHVIDKNLYGLPLYY